MPTPPPAFKPASCMCGWPEAGPGCPSCDPLRKKVESITRLSAWSDCQRCGSANHSVVPTDRPVAFNVQCGMCGDVGPWGVTPELAIAEWEKYQRACYSKLRQRLVDSMLRGGYRSANVYSIADRMLAQRG